MVLVSSRLGRRAQGCQYARWPKRVNSRAGLPLCRPGWRTRKSLRTGTCGGQGLVEALAYRVNDLVEIAGDLRVFGDSAGQGVRCGVEEPPAGLLAPVMSGIFPLSEHVGDA